MALKEGWVYCTNLAFSNGVYAALLKSKYKSTYVSIPIGCDMWQGFNINDKDVHTTWESAMQEVERMRAAKIASLEKQIKKVKEKTFTEPE